MGIPVTTLPSGTSQGVITLSPGTSKGVVTLSVRPTPTVLPSGISKGIATLSAADPNLAVVLTAPSKTNPILVKPYAPKSTKTASAASRFSANMALNLASSPALVQQWNNNSVLWLLPYAASGNSLSTTNWVNTGQNFWSNPDTSPDLLMLDINGDGKTDVVQQWNNNGTLWLLPYISNGTSFTPTNWINTGQGYISGPGGTPGMLALDINGDGMTDLVEQWNNNGTLYLLPYISNGTGFNTTNWINTGQGFGSGPNGTPGLVVLDINGDGKMDLVQQWNNNGAFYLLPYISNGTSFAPTNWINTGQGYGTGPGGTQGLLALDMNGDGMTDLIQQWNNNGTLWLLPYISNGTSFATTNWINTQQGYGTGYGGTPWLLPMDINGDGQTDLVQQWDNNGTLWLLPYISTGTSYATTNWINTQQGYATPGLIALDINGDGKTDLVQQWNNNGTLWLLPYISSGTTLSTTNWINTGQGYGSGLNGTPGLLGGSYINPAPVIQYYTISGQVTANGAGLAGVAVTLTGNSSESATTDANGNYSFTVPAGGTYTVTPSLSGSAFSPSSQTLSNLGSNETVAFSVTSSTSPLSGSLVPQPPPESAPSIVPPPVVTASAVNCNDISGTWNDSTGYNSYALSQVATSVSGVVTTTEPGCGQFSATVQGNMTGLGTFTLTLTAPATDACGVPIQPNQATENVTLSGCSAAQAVVSSGSSGFTGSGGGGGTVTWSRSSVPPGVTLSVDLMGGTVTTVLSGQNKAGPLSIQISGTSQTQTLAAHAGASAGSSFTDKLQRTSLGVGQYGSVVATWDTTGVTTPVSFYVIGNTRFTQYNAPYENQCSSNPQPAWIIFKMDNINGCYYSSTTLGSLFITQTNLNGFGVTQANQVLASYKTGAYNVCPAAPRGFSNGSNTFFAVDAGGAAINKITGAHGSVLSDGTGTASSFLNNNPKPGSLAKDPDSSILSFGDQIMMVDQSDSPNPDIRSIQDSCGACGGGFGSPAAPGTVAHIDTFSSSHACTGLSDFGNRVAIRLR